MPRLVGSSAPSVIPGRALMGRPAPPPIGDSTRSWPPFLSATSRTLANRPAPNCVRIVSDQYRGEKGTGGRHGRQEEGISPREESRVEIRAAHGSHQHKESPRRRPDGG